MPEVSIVIRAYNEEKHLPAVFDALGRQAFRDFETIVVDSGSYDRTREIAEKRANRLLRIKQADFTFGHSLNIGIEASSGRFIVMLSAHAVPTGPGWLEALVAPLRSDRTAMVYGRQEGTEDSKYSERRDFERLFPSGETVHRSPEFVANNANSAIRRDLWEKHRFDEFLPGFEDIDWAKYWVEQGYKVAYEPAASVLHIHLENWAQVRNRYYREGQAGRWIGLRSRRALPVDVARQALWFLQDSFRALRSRDWTKLPEIARFRFQKAAGDFMGVWDGALMENPRARSRLLYDRTCKAVVVHRPDHASLTDIEVPELSPGDALVRVAHVGVCGTDLEIVNGSLEYYRSGKASFPIVPGHEVSGTVVAVGARAGGIKAGDRVVAECIQGCGECPACRAGNMIGCPGRQELGVMGSNGGYAEYMTLPARYLHVVPQEIPLRAAALCEPLAVALKGLRRVSPCLGRGTGAGSYAVVGAGPIGHLAARVLSLRGHPVTAFDRDARRLSYFGSGGVATSLDLAELPGFDAIIEATGDPGALDEILRRSRAGATILLLGLPYSKREFSFESVVTYDKTIVGSVGSTAEDFEGALKVLPALDTAPFLEKSLPLSQFELAWTLARQQRHLKLMLDP